MKRLVRILAAVAVAAPLLVLSAAAPASAAVLTSPDSFGATVLCQATYNFEQFSLSGSNNTNISAQVKCAFAAGKASDFTLSNMPVQLQGTINGVSNTFDTGPNGGCPAYPTATPATVAHSVLSASLNTSTKQLQNGLCGGGPSTMSTMTVTGCRYWNNAAWRTDCRIDGAAVRTWSAPASYPSDWYPGGTPILPSAPAIVPACSRTLSSQADMNAYLKNTTATVAGATDAYSWAFGDGSAANTNASPSHHYTAAMADGGWTATLTITRTGDGITYTAGPSTATCALRVDFANPTQSTPATVTTGSTDDTTCPSGFGWINPLAIGNILRCLFIPSTNPFDAFQAAYQGSLVDQATAPITVMTGIVSGINDGVSDGSIAACSGLSVDVPLTPLETAKNTFTFSPMRTCEDGPMKTVAGLVHGAAYFLILITTVTSVLRIAASAFGIHISGVKWW